MNVNEDGDAWIFEIKLKKYFLSEFRMHHASHIIKYRPWKARFTPPNISRTNSTNWKWAEHVILERKVSLDQGPKLPFILSQWVPECWKSFLVSDEFINGFHLFQNCRNDITVKQPSGVTRSWDCSQSLTCGVLPDECFVGCLSDAIRKPIRKSFHNVEPLHVHEISRDEVESMSKAPDSAEVLERSVYCQTVLTNKLLQYCDHSPSRPVMLEAPSVQTETSFSNEMLFSTSFWKTNWAIPFPDWSWQTSKKMGTCMTLSSKEKRAKQDRRCSLRTRAESRAHEKNAHSRKYFWQVCFSVVHHSGTALHRCCNSSGSFLWFPQTVYWQIPS